MALRSCAAVIVATTGPRARASPAPQATGRRTTMFLGCEVSTIARGEGFFSFVVRGRAGKSIQGLYQRRYASEADAPRSNNSAHVSVVEPEHGVRILRPLQV